MTTKINEKILAKACITIILKQFSASDDGRLNFRLKNLTPSVYESLLQQWEELESIDDVAGITIFVAHDSPISCKDKYRVAENKTITDARNDLNIKKLVYLETKDESDGQSHKSFFTLRDTDILKGTLDVHNVLDGKEILTEHALDEATRHPGKKHLSSLCQSLIKALISEGVSVSALKYASFVYMCGIDLEAFEGAVDQKDLLKVTGSNLIYLDLFNDEGWFFNDKVAGKRLYFNSLCAELARSETQDLDVDKEIENVKTLIFKDENQESYDEPEQNHWRDLCIAYLTERSFSVRKQIPFRIFEQLFSKTLPGLQLGQLVKQEILNADSDRISEFNELYVTEGLDKKLQEAAEAFLEAEPENDNLPSLKSLISTRTRKKIEAIANPKAKKFDNPFIQISESLNGFSIEEEFLSEFTLKLSLDDKTELSNNPTLGLFNFLYSESLKHLIEISTDDEGVSFVCDECLTEQQDYPQLTDDPDDDTKEIQWQPIRFNLQLIRTTDGEITEIIDTDGPVEWLPESGELIHLSFFWHLVGELPEFYDKELVLENVNSFEDSLKSLMTGDSTLNDHISVLSPQNKSSDEILISAFEAKKELVNTLSKSGMAAEPLEKYVDSLEDCYLRASKTYIPNNQIEPVPATLISMDLLADSNNNATVMLPFHPLKARWISRYLRETIRLAQSALTKRLCLNHENSDLYFNWVNTLSPEQFPAIASNNNSDLLVSARVNGWFEYFTSANSLISVESGTPRIIMDEIVKKIHQYLHHHPHKIDGLSITLITKDDAGIAAHLVSRVRTAEFSKARITINLIADPRVWSRAISEFESVDSDNRFTMDGALFPEVELRLYKLNTDTLPDEHELDELNSDILVIPHFLEEKNTYQERNKVNSQEIILESSFDSIYEEPIYIEPSTGNAISVALLPNRVDPLSESWSTMVTRQVRLSPVSTSAFSEQTGTDYIVKLIKFNENEKLLELSHKIAHWVITIEQYLTREQIENLPSSPDIISFKSNVGPGGKYSLMVSSSIGKKFILERLQKKLSKILDETQYTPEGIASIAETIYEDTRHLAPELALDALGVARVTEEILGLAVARRALDNVHDLKIDNGISVIISLDNYKNWFSGGDSALRADMLKLVFELDDDGLNVFAYVLESKLRKDTTLDTHGEQQVLTTIRLIEQFLDCDLSSKNLDSELWRRNIVSAIDNASDKAFTYSGQLNSSYSKLDPFIRDKFILGDYHLKLISGFFIQSSISATETIQIIGSKQDKRVINIKIGKQGIINALTQENSLSELKNKINLVSNDARVQPEKVVGEDKHNHSANNEIEDTEIDSSNSYQPEKKPIESDNDRIGLSDEQLKAKYQEVITILSHKHSLNIKAVDWDKNPVIEGPSSFLYRLEYHGNNPNEIAQKHDSLKLDLKLEEAQLIKFGIDAGYVTLDVPKKDTERYFIEANNLWNKFRRKEQQFSIPLGINRFGEAVEINFTDSNSPHLLIGGTTGSGKSEALNTILTGLAKFYNSSELQLWLVDPKGNELTLYEDLEIVPQDIAVYEDEAMEIISKAVEEMNTRYAKFRETSKSLKTRTADLASYNKVVQKEEQLPWWLIVIDEYSDLTTDNDFKKEFEKQVMRIAQKGRASGVHLIIATQKPSGNVISTTLRSNLPSALALRVRDYHASRVIIDENGAEALIGRGDGIFKRQGSVERIQCAWVSDIPRALGLS